MERRSQLQREIRQSRPFASPGQEAVVGLVRTADVVRRRLAGVTDGRGITLQQYNVLRILRGAGDRGLPTLGIGERMVQQAPGITRLLDRLEGKRLVRRERCPEDRRRVYCAVTRAGLELLASLDAPMLAADEDCVAALKDRERLTLIRLLDRIRVEPDEVRSPERSRKRRLPRLK